MPRLKPCSSLFAQLYIVHNYSSILNGTIPVLYSLLPTKTKEICTTLFNESRCTIGTHDLVLNPKVITIDFEQGALNALKNLFLSTSIKGCNFHFNQCLFKRIQ